MSETEVLPCKMNTLECQEKGHELARLILAHDEIEREKKAEAKEWGERLKRSAAELIRVSNEVESGLTDRLVEVRESASVVRGCVDVIRADTLEVVRSRAMTQLEREELNQGNLFVQKGEKPKPKGKRKGKKA